jgi:prevent-host-death family protein
MTITSTQLKQETYLIDNAIKEDILVTKRGRPFVVIMDATRYHELIDNQLSEEDKTEQLDASKEPRAGWDDKFKNMDETEYLQVSKKNKDRLDNAIEQLDSGNYISKKLDT